MECLNGSTDGNVHVFQTSNAVQIQKVGSLSRWLLITAHWGCLWELWLQHIGGLWELLLILELLYIEAISLQGPGNCNIEFCIPYV